MGLRVLLVGLVASLGLDMPSGEQVSGWSDAGRGWVNARLADLSSLRDEADRSFAAATDCERVKDVVVADVQTPGAVADASFDTVGKKMATDFADDLESLRAEALATPAPVMVAQPEPTPVAAPAPVVVFEVESNPAVTCGEPDVVSIEPEVSPYAEPTTVTAKASRLNSAVRLTIEAAQAWASVIEGDSAEPTH